MASTVELLGFLAEQTAQHSRLFGASNSRRLLSLVGTCREHGAALDVAARRIVRLAMEPDRNALVVELHGPLPRPLRHDECATVVIADYLRYRGYQLKTEDLGTTTRRDPVRTLAGGDVAIDGRRIYTVHLGPNVLKLFERVPYDEIVRDVGGVSYAVVGVGLQANISPRFVFHQEQRAGTIALFFGEGHANKSYLNLQHNARVSHLILDQRSGAGWGLAGRQQEFAPDDEPTARGLIDAGFAAGNWGRPQRYFLFTADSWNPIGV